MKAKKKYFHIQKKFQTSPLSHIPGGKSVVMFFYSGPSKRYDDIKSPYLYFKQAQEDDPNVKGYKVLD